MKTSLSHAAAACSSKKVSRDAVPTRRRRISQERCDSVILVEGLVGGASRFLVNVAHQLNVLDRAVGPALAFGKEASSDRRLGCFGEGKSSPVRKLIRPKGGSHLSCNDGTDTLVAKRVAIEGQLAQSATPRVVGNETRNGTGCIKGLGRCGKDCLCWMSQNA